MRIGIDGRYIQDQYHGIGRYVYQVALEWASQNPDHQLIVFHNPRYANSRFDLAALGGRPNVTLAPTALRPFWPHEQLLWPLLLRRHRIDLFHATYVAAPLLAVCPVVMTIYDLIFDRYPDYMPRRWFRLYYRTMLRLSLHKARRVLAISQATKRDLVECYPVAPQKVQVTPLAAAPAFRPIPQQQAQAVRARYGLPRRFVLTVGTRRPHKNVTTLVRAFAEIAQHTDADLVLAGQADARWPDQITPLVEQLALNSDAGRPRVVQPGHIAEADLPALYTLADVFVFPSLIEGFGLPALEAMACGTAVVASNTSSLPEIVGDAGLLASPRDTQALAGAILTLLQDSAYRQELATRSLARAAAFNWPRTARLVTAAYDAALSNEPLA